MNSSEEMKKAHADIKAFLPPAAFVVVEHSIRNYKDETAEMWSCQVYEDNDTPLNLMFSVYNESSSDLMVIKAQEEFDGYKPCLDDKIAKLESQIAKLRGRK